MKTSIVIWNCSFCPHCKKRFSCSCRDDSTPQGTPAKRAGGCYYRCDANTYRRIRERAEEELDAIRRSLKRVKPKQLFFTKSLRVEFDYLPKVTRRRNARGGKVEWLSYGARRKWCEQCGEAFETANSHRRICNACHEEICEKIGANYALPKTIWNCERN